MGAIAAGVIGVAGLVGGMMASAEATGNANAAAQSNFINNEHQARLKVQHFNDKQIQNYQKQLLQNLYIQRTATSDKIRNSSSLNRASRAQAISQHESNKAAFDLMSSSNGSRGISGSSGTALAMKRQALNHWGSSVEAFKFNTRQEQEKIALQYDNTLRQQGSDVFMTNSYIGGQPPPMQSGTMQALNAGISGGIAGAKAGWSVGNGMANP